LARVRDRYTGEIPKREGEKMKFAEAAVLVLSVTLGAWGALPANAAEPTAHHVGEAMHYRYTLEIPQLSVTLEGTADTVLAAFDPATLTYTVHTTVQFPDHPELNQSSDTPVTQDQLDDNDHQIATLVQVCGQDGAGQPVQGTATDEATGQAVAYSACEVDGSQDPAVQRVTYRLSSALPVNGMAFESIVDFTDGAVRQTQRIELVSFRR
jgi:hypothetical protein